MHMDEVVQSAHVGTEKQTDLGHKTQGLHLGGVITAKFIRKRGTGT